MIRVLIAHNEPIRAKGLEAILTAGGLQVVAVCHDLFELFESVERHHPQVAILDDSIVIAPEVLFDLHRLAPGCETVGWPALNGPDSSARLVEAVQMLASFTKPAPLPAAVVSSNCNADERHLMRLVGYGLNNEQIAAMTGMDRGAVQQSLEALADRLGTEDRYDLALYGLTTLNERTA